MKSLNVAFNGELVLIGAACHDAGKIIFPAVLNESGSLHETAGEKLLRGNCQEWIFSFDLDYKMSRDALKIDMARLFGERMPTTEDIALAIVVRKQRVLVQKRYRQKCGFLFEFPGGSPETNESWFEAASRELYEETGLTETNCHDVVVKPSAFGEPDRVCDIFIKHP